MIAAYLSIVRPFLRQWPWWALFSSALMLAIAHGFETFGGLAPCTLCLRQREVYWVAMAVSAVAVVASYLPALKPWAVRLLCGALAITFLVGMGIAIWHAGAEWKWWPGPAACASRGKDFTAAGLNDLLAGARQAQPSCDEALWRMFGLSMAGWNVLISLKLTWLSGLAAFGWGERRP